MPAAGSAVSESCGKRSGLPMLAMGEGSYNTFGERNSYPNTAAPQPATASDPSPSLTNELRRVTSSGFSWGELLCSLILTLFRSSNSLRNLRWYEPRLRWNECCHAGLGPVIAFHRDHVHRAALRAQAAANTPGLVFEHGRPGDDAQFAGGDI